MAAVFALSREREVKRIDRTWVLSKDELDDVKYSALVGFLGSNLALVLNRPESEFLARTQPKQAPYRLPSVDTRKERSCAYLVNFDPLNQKKLTLLGLASIRATDEFQRLTRDIAQWFANTQNWPKSYLFITNFEVVEGTARVSLIGILTSELTYGSFVEDPSRIVEQLKRGVMGDTVRKALICPHITGKRGDSYLTEPKAKVYEETPEPAQYFYNFAGLIPPRVPEELVGEVLGEVATHHYAEPLSHLSRALSETPGIENLVKAQVAVDDLTIQVSLSQLSRALRFVRLAGGRKGVLLFGTTVTCQLADRDLFASGLVKFLPHDEAEDLVRS